jgi:uncharacterized Zn finger protein
MRRPRPEAETPRGAPKCPFCASRDAEVISLFGTQAMTLQYRCRSCGSLYEAIKYDREEAETDPSRSRRPPGGAA